jgi:hypothetical protein
VPFKCNLHHYNQGGPRPVRLYKLNSLYPSLESDWFQALSLKCNLLFSNVAFKFNLCRYSPAAEPKAEDNGTDDDYGAADDGNESEGGSEVSWSALPGSKEPAELIEERRRAREAEKAKEGRGGASLPGAGGVSDCLRGPHWLLADINQLNRVFTAE